MGRARGLKKSLHWQKPRTARYYNGVWLKSELGLRIYKAITKGREIENIAIEVKPRVGNDSKILKTVEKW
jgi:hypothetical protein